jgi:hypothetical protein
MLVVEARLSPNPLPDPMLLPPPVHLVEGVKVLALPPPLLSKLLVMMLLLPQDPLEGAVVGVDCECCHFLNFGLLRSSSLYQCRLLSLLLLFCFIIVDRASYKEVRTAYVFFIN